MVVTNRCYVFEMALQRFYRTIVMRGAALAGGSALTVICSCDGGGGEVADAGCPKSVSLYSPCGFEHVITTCGDGTASCNGNSCTISAPIAKDCTIDVKLADGTQTTVNVTVVPCVYANPSYFKCKTLDAGSDASDDASDAADADTNDAPIDAPSDG
jgi:hypothetical protein